MEYLRAFLLIMIGVSFIRLSSSMGDIHMEKIDILSPRLAAVMAAKIGKYYPKDEKVYCSNCGIVELPLGHVELCSGCIQDIVEWLERDDMARQTEVIANEVSYQKQFSL